MIDKITINIAEALNAIVEQESDRYRVQFDASATASRAEAEDGATLDRFW
jgi:hypothetical protein